MDLDGTLIRSDMLVESVVRLMSRSPASIFGLILAVTSGRAQLKSWVAERLEIDPRDLPYRQEILSFIVDERRAGREVVLATASDSRYANAIAKHLGCFSSVEASDGLINLKGAVKAQRLKERFGSFEYIGDSKADLPVFQAAEGALVVGDSAWVEEALGRDHVVRVFDSPKQSKLRVILRACRVHQWVKNLLLLVPVILAHQLGDPPKLIGALLGLVAFSLIASSVYLLNDLVDLEADRKHHTKSKRPLAAGELALPVGILLVPLLISAGVFLSSFLSPSFWAILAGYLAVTVVYSFRLKRVAVLDVVTLALLYTIRIIAGGYAAGVEVSAWLLSFSMFFFLGLAWVKRYAELYHLRQEPGKAVHGRGYVATDLPLVASFGVASSYLSILVLGLYLTRVEVADLYASPDRLWFLLPIFLYWVSRVWLLAGRGEMNEDPIVFAIHDRASFITGLVAVVILLAASWG